MEGGDYIGDSKHCNTTKKISKYQNIAKKIAKYSNTSVGRVETWCYTKTSALYVKFRANKEFSIFDLAK